MEALRLAYPRLHGADRLILPQPEEELFTFSTLELFDTKHGDDVQIHHRLSSKADEIAQKSRAHIMRVKGIWLRAIFFDENVFLDGSEDVKDFMAKFKALNKELQRCGAVPLPEPDETVCNPATALAYKIKILFFARNYFADGSLQDIGHHFWFEDKEGIRYSDEEVRQWPLLAGDLDHLLSELKRARTADFSEIAKIFGELFGEKVSARSIEVLLNRAADNGIEQGARYERGTGAVLLSDVVAAPAIVRSISSTPPHNFHCGIKKK